MAESFRAEASCPLCRGLFQDPVSVPCGHSFCRGCIARRWEIIDLTCEEASREPAARGSLRPNPELAKVIEVAARLSLRGRGGHGGHRFCGTHRQALKLFCERERVLICLACREAPEHRDHAVVPTEEATEEYKEKLQAHVQVLKDRRAKLLRLRASEEGKSLDLLERVAAERQKVASGIEGLRRLVEEQERVLLGRLAELDGEVARRREESMGRLSQEIASIGEDIAELEGKCRQSAWEFLQDIGSILGRLEEEEEVPKPDEVSLVLGERPMGFPEKNAALWEMLLRFQASLTLDPDTAHPSLALSADGKSVRCEAARRALPAHPKRFDASRCVLARQAFSGGRHYWEVAVGAGDAWAIGVARESVPRKGRLRVHPANGVWAVGRCGDGVGFEPTPPFGDQKSQEREEQILESGALDHSAILTTGPKYPEKGKYPPK
ncbi:E3 ubiquitin-protein ligase TRIM41-like [Nothoprocta perdicaria]|uniref:E3 ubiquitin-protein ligase TRIM41-like n=1 Tax=Nothoprocta perdicaria TaxID=30464 RepID=UPI000E1BFA03|nr:E3 ubiquitin-protein ligase TRIM41-like [Nothoprocta perdicaria]